MGGGGARGTHLLGGELGQAGGEQGLLPGEELPPLVLRVAKGQAQDVVGDDVLAVGLHVRQPHVTVQVLAGTLQGQLAQLIHLDAPGLGILNLTQHYQSKKGEGEGLEGREWVRREA